LLPRRGRRRLRLWPAGAQFQTGVQSGDGLVVVTFTAPIVGAHGSPADLERRATGSLGNQRWQPIGSAWLIAL
jgi:hypothetical protein